MARPAEITALPAVAAAQIAEEALVLRGALLLASDGRSRLVVSDGGSGLTQFDDASRLERFTPTVNLNCIDHRCEPRSSSADVSAPVSFMCVSPPSPAQREGPLRVALASGCALKIISLGPDAEPSVQLLNVLSSPEHLRWLGASWHPQFSGLLAAICQAEVRVVLCPAHEEGPSCDGIGGRRSCTGEGEGEAAAAPQPPFQSRAPVMLDLSRLGYLPSGPGGQESPGAPCRSVQCHVEWVGEGDGGGAACGEEDGGSVATLVVGWGPDLELVTWPVAAIRAVVAEAAGVQQQGSGDGGGRPLLLGPPASRRTLLLGVPGPLSAVVRGPYGSVMATTDACLALAPSVVQPPAESELEQLGGTGSDAGGDEALSGNAEGGKEPGREAGGTGGGVRQRCQPEEVIDLRGGVGADGPVPRLGDGGGGLGGGSSLAGLFNIASGLRLEEGGAAAVAAGGRGAAAVPPHFLLAHGAAATTTTTGTGVAAMSQGALCVVWPGRMAGARGAAADEAEAAAAAPGAATAPCPALSAIAGSGRVGRSLAPPRGFRAVTPLGLPRPDLLSCCGCLVLAASSVGPPVVAAFGLSPRGGLTQLATLTPTVPGVIDPARGRLRGLAAVLAPPQGPEGQGGQGAVSWGPAGGAGAELGGTAMLVVVMGEMEQPAPGGGIVGFGRSGRPLGVKMAPLLTSAHLLAPQLAAHAATPTAARAESAKGGEGPAAAAASAPAVARGPPATPAGTHASAVGVTAALAGDAPPAAAAPAAAAPDAVAAAVVGQLAELLGGIRRHVDQRLDELAGSMQTHAARLERIEAAMAQQQPPGQQQQQQ